MFQSISLLRKPGASVSAEVSTGSSSPILKLRSLEFTLDAKDDPMEQLKQKPAQLPVPSTPSIASDADERSFPCMEDDVNNSTSRLCAAPTMARANADSGFFSPQLDQGFPYIADYGRSFPLQFSASSEGNLSPAGLSNCSSIREEDALDVLMSPKHHLVEMMAIHDIICVPPPPPPSPLIGDLTSQSGDRYLAEYQWSGLLASLLAERSGRVSHQ